MVTVTHKFSFAVRNPDGFESMKTGFECALRAIASAIHLDACTFELNYTLEKEGGVSLAFSTDATYEHVVITVSLPNLYVAVTENSFVNYFIYITSAMYKVIHFMELQNANPKLDDFELEDTCIKWALHIFKYRFPEAYGVYQITVCGRFISYPIPEFSRF